MIKSFVLSVLVSFSFSASAATLVAGSSKASVQVLVYGDLQCPYTASFMKNLPRYEKDFGARIGIQFAHFPLEFHAEAKPAAIAATCAALQGEGRLFILDTFLNQTTMSRADYLATAKGLVKDIDAFTACLDSKEALAIVESDYAAGIASGVQGTPYIFINGELVKGAYPYEDFKAKIEAALQSR